MKTRRSPELQEAREAAALVPKAKSPSLKRLAVRRCLRSILKMVKKEKRPQLRLV